jgi:4-hydroxy-tetrahydrodipicolinate synthase
MAKAKLEGSMVAIVTPFAKGGSIDYKRLRELVGWHEDQGTDWILACGTTGESATMTHEEHNKVISTVVDAASKAHVMGGTASNDTKKAVAQVKEVSALGVDAVLALSPYYNKPTQEGYFQHFSALARASSRPVVIYNVPGRTGGNIEAATTLRLSRVDGIGGVKEASGNMGQIMKVAAGAPKRFALISGDDPLTYPMIACGATGVISVTANLLPKWVADMVHLALAGDWDKARALHERMLPVHEVLFIESNPIPVKEAMNLAGLRVGGYRLPLTPIAPANRERLKQVLSAAGAL